MLSLANLARVNLGVNEVSVVVAVSFTDEERNNINELSSEFDDEAD